MKQHFTKVADRIEKLNADDRRHQFKLMADELGFLESVFNTLSEGIFVVNAEGALVYSNVAAERLTAAPLAQGRGRPVRDLLPGWDWDDLLVPATEGDGWSRKATRVVELLCPKHRILELGALPNETGIVVIARDVTREHELANDARECERTDAIQELAAGIAHEIGNPLNAVSMTLQLLAREFRHEPDAARRERLLADIASARNEVNRIAEINRSFLTAIRPVNPVLTVGSLADPLSSTLAAVKAQIENRRIRVTLNLPPALPPVARDAAQMEQVFFNLIKNALEVLPDEGTLDISLDSDDNVVSVAIKDSGCGMDADTLANMFATARTTKLHGNGLGLMLSNRIVRAHGGDIDVESKPGAGTKFTVRIPRLEKRIRRLA